MARGGDHLAGDAEVGERPPRIHAAEEDVPLGPDGSERLAWLHPAREPVDGGHLLLEDPERHAVPLEILSTSGMIDVVVCREPRANRVEWDVLPPEFVL